MTLPAASPPNATKASVPSSTPGLVRNLIAAWGTLGVVALFAQAIWRLAPYAVEPLRTRTLTPGQAALYAAWAGVSLYYEGHRAMQKRFCPRVVARAFYLADNASAFRVLVAPLFCMGFFHANRRTKALAWGTTIMVIGFITILRRTPQPWRGIVDGGVVLALGWGAVALVLLFFRGLAGNAVGSPELPEDPIYRAGAVGRSTDGRSSADHDEILYGKE